MESWSWTNRPIDQLVGFSNHAALVETVAYARRKGYKRPAFVASFQSGDDRAQERLEGYLEGMSGNIPGQSVPHGDRRTICPIASAPDACSWTWRASNTPTVTCSFFQVTCLPPVRCCPASVWESRFLRACDHRIRRLRDVRGVGPRADDRRCADKRIGQDAARIILQRLKGGKAGPRKARSRLRPGSARKRLSARILQQGREGARRPAYFARFNTTSAEPPLEAGVVHFSSSPVTVKGRFCSVPFQFGNVLLSIWKMMVLSASLTVYVPK